MVVAGADTELGLGFSEYDTTKAAERGRGLIYAIAIITFRDISTKAQHTNTI